MKITETEIERIRRQLCEQLGNASTEPAAVADFATRALARILGDYQELRHENAKLLAERRCA